jgi:hypothetical protein
MGKVARFQFNKPTDAEMGIAKGAVTRLTIDVNGHETESAAIT